MMALDNDRHYRVSHNDIDVLIRRGGNWLEAHPEKEWITRRFLKNLRSLSSQALARLSGEPEWIREEVLPEKKINLHQLRLQKAFDLLKASSAGRVLNIGCGEGKLLKLLLKEGQFTKIAGMDVSFAELRKARENLYLDQASPAMRERIHLQVRHNWARQYKGSAMVVYEHTPVPEITPSTSIRGAFLAANSAPCTIPRKKSFRWTQNRRTTNR
jgi:SAM-dependent methyltransferase